MWCIETIVALNKKLAEGVDLNRCYTELKIQMPTIDSVQQNLKRKMKEAEEERS